MKRVLIFVILLCLLSYLPVIGQSYTCTIRNQSVSSNNFYFDVYILRTGSDTLYLANADFAVNFNSAFFTNPVASRISSDLVIGPYTVSPAVVPLLTGNRIVVSVNPPYVDNIDDFNALVHRVSNSGYGTKIATVRVTNITTPSGTAGITWRTADPNKSFVFNYDNSTFDMIDVTSNGTYINPSDYSLPVEMTSIVATASRERGVVVGWRVESETDCAGFHVLRSLESDGNYDQITPDAAMISGRGNASEAKDYEFVDRNVETGKVYWYKIVEVSTDGKRETYGPISVTALSPVPTEFGFSECYPNPFNPETTVDYKTAKDGSVSVIVYNLMGKQVRTLVSGSKPAGYYKALWNGRDDRGDAVPTGIYFIRMQSGDYSRVRKVMMMK